MTLPDFLVIGAAKSGTVSLYHYLGQHPQIFMCPVNETNFFALDGFDLDNHFRGPGDRAIVESHCIKTMEAYQATFAQARPDQRLGESSPLYLYSAHAPLQMKKHVPEVRLVAILRQPAARAYSNYRHYRRAGIEPLSSFREALAAEAERLQAGWGPWPFWAYRHTGLYATQLERYCAQFRREQILVALFEDLQENPAGLLRQIFAFIGVDEGFVPDTSIRHNVGGKPHVGFLYSLMTRPNRLKTLVRLLLPDVLREGLRDTIHRWNLAEPLMDSELLHELTRTYADDIHRLEDLIGRDLSHWLADI